MAETTGDKVRRELESRGFKREKGNGSGEEKWRGNNPLRPGSDSDGFVVFIAPDGEHGGFNSFGPSEPSKGSLYDLAKLLGIELPEKQERQPATITKRSYRNMIEYAVEHGVPVETFKAAGWYETIHQDRTALAFPTHSGLYYRFIDGEKPTFKPHNRGYKRCWYGLNATTSERLRAGQPLVIANGPPSVVVAHYYGLAAACITGGEKETGFPQELIEDLKTWLGADLAAQVDILIALDCDAKGVKAARTVKQQMKDVGFSAWAVDLGFTKGGDLADFCKLHQEAAVDRLIEQPNLEDVPDIEVPPDQSLGFYFIKLRDLHKLPPLRFLLDGMLVANGINVVFGDSGVGKSFFAIDQAMRLAMNNPVLYVVGEGEEGYRQRTDAWLIHHKLSLETVTTIKDSMTLSIGAPLLLETNHLETFIAMARPIQPILVVIDTLSTSLSGDENNAKDMGLYLRACKAINRELGSATLLVHHTGKDGSTIRGSSQIRGWSSQMIKMSDDDGIICIESDKIKDAAKLPPKYMRLLNVEVGVDEAGNMVNSAVIIDAKKVVQRPTDPLTNHQAKILDVLALEAYRDEGASPSEIAEIVGCGTGSVVKVLSKMMRLGFASKEGGHKPPYKLTLDGDLALARFKGVDGISDASNGILEV